jgi:iron complex transport system substrate-binding protein
LINKIFVTLSVIIIFTACHKTELAVSANDNTSTINFTDSDGKQIRLQGTCKRIISLYNAHTENLFEIGAGEYVIGVYKSGTYSAGVKELPKYDYRGDAEYIIAAEPDLVLIRPFIRRQNPAYIEELEKAGVLVVSLFPETLAEFDSYVMRLALLTGKENEATGRLVIFNDELNRIKIRGGEIKNKPKVFIETTANEIRTAAAGSLPAMAIVYAGGENIAQGSSNIARNSPIAPFGIEELLKYADTLDAYIIQQGAMDTTANITALRSRPGFNAIGAVRNGNVLFIDETIISSPTFRYVEGVKKIQEFLFPLSGGD